MGTFNDYFSVPVWIGSESRDEFGEESHLYLLSSTTTVDLCKSSAVTMMNLVFIFPPVPSCNYEALHNNVQSLMVNIRKVNLRL